MCTISVTIKKVTLIKTLKKYMAYKWIHNHIESASQISIPEMQCQSEKQIHFHET